MEDNFEKKLQQFQVTNCNQNANHKYESYISICIDHRCQQEGKNIFQPLCVRCVLENVHGFQDHRVISIKQLLEISDNIYKNENIQLEINQNSLEENYEAIYYQLQLYIKQMNIFQEYIEEEKLKTKQKMIYLNEKIKNFKIKRDMKLQKFKQTQFDILNSKNSEDLNIKCQKLNDYLKINQNQILEKQFQFKHDDFMDIDFGKRIMEIKNNKKQIQVQLDRVKQFGSQILDNFESYIDLDRKNSLINVEGRILYQDIEADNCFCLFKVPKSDNFRFGVRPLCDAEFLQGIGLCQIEFLEKNNYILTDEKLESCQHFCYLLDDSGIVYCHNDQQINDKTLGFTVQKKDTLICDIDYKNGNITFILQSDQKKQFQMKFDSSQRDKYAPCIFMTGGSKYELAQF